MRSLSLARLIVVVVCFFVLCTLLLRIGRAVHYNVFPHPHPTLLDLAPQEPYPNQTTHSVDLVLATISSDDTTWTSHLDIPALNVVRYVGNDASAKHHPPRPKGNEALMYLTYLHDSYDNLPDIVIFTHGQEIQWHIEGTLLQNLSFALPQLDLGQIVARGFFNLRATWRAGCPSWIDTTKSPDDWKVEEEPYMRDAWSANFGGEVPPEKIGGPCCSQFAVTRDAIRSQPREQFKASMDWILASHWSDRILGRVWEHMWPRLFTGEADDCKVGELESLCQMYRICFRSEEELKVYKELWNERERLKEDMSPLWAVWDAGRAVEARERMGVVKGEIEGRLRGALQNGRGG